MKFYIGDIITGVEDSPYSVTNSCGTYEVIRVYDDKFIRVKVLEHIESYVIDHGFDVESKHFVYAEGFAHWEGIFNGVSKDSPCYKQLCAEYAKYMKSMEKESMT